MLLHRVPVCLFPAVVQRKFYQKTERVKAVDIHPTEPWILTSLYSGHVVIWNYVTQVAVKSFEVTELPIRAGKFIPRKQWVVTGSDDMMIRAYNVNTQERVTEIHGACSVWRTTSEAHWVAVLHVTLCEVRARVQRASCD
jgi:WD40 repeat protein